MKARLPLQTALAAGLALSTLTFAQNAQPTNNGWPREDAPRTSAAANPDDSPYSQQASAPYEGPAPGGYDQQNGGPPPNDEQDRAGQNEPGPDRYRQPVQRRAYRPQDPIPAQLTIAPGTYLTVRVNQELSSDRNQRGDAFAATLVQPVVVNGVVVAEPGETLGGVVADAQKGGRVQGVARLSLQITDLTLVDGQRLPLQTQLIARSADTSNGRDAGAIVGSTAAGAAIGGIADYGRGAAIGAGAGAAAGIIGVLVTRGHASVVYPEQVLTFRIEAPVALSTVNSAQAFHYIQPGEYDRHVVNASGTRPTLYARPAYPSYYYAPYGYGYGWGYGGYPYYYGPSVGFYVGRGGYYGGRHWRR